MISNKKLQIEFSFYISKELELLHADLEINQDTGAEWCSPFARVVVPSPKIVINLLYTTEVLIGKPQICLDPFQDRCYSVYKKKYRNRGIWILRIFSWKMIFLFEDLENDSKIQNWFYFSRKIYKNHSMDLGYFFYPFRPPIPCKWKK